MLAGASRVWYDDFYEDVTFVERRDWQYDAGMSLSYRVAGGLLANVGARYVRRDSTFEFAAFDGFEGRIGAGLLYRF